MSGVLAMEFESFVCVRPRGFRGGLPSVRNTGTLRRVDNDHSAMITAANAPQTITNALMICFSSETDIASSARDQTDIAPFSTTPVLGAAGVVTLMRARCVRGG